MTDAEIEPSVGKAVRLTLADGRILAGVLEAEHGGGHGHRHYAIVSGAVREGGQPARVLIHGAEQIAMIEDASSDPAAST
jgi:hypothetical protein